MKTRNNKIHIYAVAAALMALGAGTAGAVDGKVHAAYEARVGSQADAHVAAKIKAMQLTDEERDAMEFLYAYMSVPDMADRTPEFYLENVRAALKARKEMPWGSKVPEREWRHFVLPIRVNNENLDMSRPVFFDELKERVKGMSMQEAILETNHWLHEKATYKPSDGRTSSPLSTVSQAIGRCGEESTFGVAALRSIGIPARQVYTPRWAHTDDNHAWVEVWADGKWHFLGACEPEPVLDLAWFNAPASRGMMMNTNVYGDYDGPEEVITRDPLTTRINVTENYAPVRTVKAVAVDKDGMPVEDADISFCIYNYAEFYPVAVKKSGKGGEAESVAGYGDMVVWATDGTNFGFAKASPEATEPVKIVMQYGPGKDGEQTLDITPPKGGTKPPYVSPEQRAENNRRFAMEDSIRGAYVATFATEQEARHAAARLGLDQDKLAKILTESRGNHQNILKAIESVPGERRWLAADLLGAVSEKDRRDIPAEVITDNALNIPLQSQYEHRVFVDYVLNPRIESEGLTPWRAWLGRELRSIPKGSRKDTDALALWIGKYITVTPDLNPQNLRMSPKAVWERRSANKISRDILYVAAARTLGFATRIDPVTGNVQKYAGGGDWRNVDFGDKRASDKIDAVNGYGTLELTFTPHDYVVDPKYYSGFSISKIENGTPRQLEYPEEATWSSTFAEPVSLETGQYILTSGQRMADGGVLAASRIFNIEPGQTTSLPLEIRKDDKALQVIGSLDAETLYHDLESNTDKSILSTTGRGYYTVALINPGHEPSAHVLNDLSLVREDLEKDGRKMLMLFSSEDDASRFDRSLFKGLPENVVFGVDKDGKVAAQLKESLHLESDEKPVVAIADTFNRVVYFTQGYTIGSGEAILQSLRRLE